MKIEKIIELVKRKFKIKKKKEPDLCYVGPFDPRIFAIPMLLGLIEKTRKNDKMPDDKKEEITATVTSDLKKMWDSANISEMKKQAKIMQKVADSLQGKYDILDRIEFAGILISALVVLAVFLYGAISIGYYAYTISVALFVVLVAILIASVIGSIELIKYY